MKYNALINKLTLSLLLVCSICVHKVAAQQCGSDIAQQKMWQAHPEFAQQEQQNTQYWNQYMQRLSASLIINTPSGPEYEIPLVVHVMNTGGAIGTTYNPTDSVIDSLVSYVNQTYAATWSAYPDTNSGGVHIPIRFVLAKRDPLCDSSTGIIRYNASGLAGYTTYGVKDAGTNGPTDSAVKSLSLWSPTDYVNVWIVNKIDGNDGTSGTFIAGFAYIPPAPRYLDGVIMLATQAHAGLITLPHELGHVLGLYHTFQGGTTTSCPPSTGNCNIDNDQVCDTEPEEQSNFNCPSGTNPCSAVGYNNVQHNFMDYSNCQNRFTAGQDTRMLYKLLNLRPGLLSSLGTTYPNGTSVASASCTPGIANPANQYDIGVTKVVLNDLQANSGGYNGDGNVSYRDESCFQRANLVTGQTYTLSVSVGSANPENTAAWIDYNNDGIFQSNEQVLTTSSTAAGGTATASVTIPTTATTCTPIRMRVMSDFYGSAAPSSCTNVQYGQTEDYSVYITSPSSASVALTTGTNPGCLGGTYMFAASSTNLGATPGYNWYVNNTLVSTNTSTYTSSSLQNGDSVWVKAYATTAGCWTTDSVHAPAIHMSLSATVATPVAGGNGPICAGGTINLTASTIAGVIYNWSGPNGFSSLSQNPSIPNATTAASGTYSVIASTVSCVSNPGSVTVTVNPTPATPIIGSNSPVCAGSALTLTASSTAGATYNWSGPNNYTSSIQNPIIASATTANAGTYTVRATLAGCVSASSTVGVTVGTPPAAPSAGSNSPVCAGTALNLTASTIAGATYSWTGPNSYTASVQNPTITSAASTNAGTYTVKANVGGCISNGATVTVVVNPSPAAPAAGSNSPICVGAALDLTASTVTGATYGWTGPNSYTATTQNPTITNAQVSNSGTYTVKATAAGCSSTATTAVTVSPNVTPSVTLTPAAATLALSTAFAANVTNGGTTPTFQWTKNGTAISGATSSSYTVALNHGDTLCVNVHSSALCANPATVKACIYATLGVSTLTTGTNDLQLYPNPNDGSFTIYGSVTDSKTAIIEVMNVLGQVVYKEEAEVQNNLLNKKIALDRINTGLYVLKVSTSIGSNTMKFTVQR